MVQTWRNRPIWQRAVTVAAVTVATSTVVLTGTAVVATMHGPFRHTWVESDGRTCTAVTTGLWVDVDCQAPTVADLFRAEYPPPPTFDEWVDGLDSDDD